MKHHLRVNQDESALMSARLQHRWTAKAFGLATAVLLLPVEVSHSASDDLRLNGIFFRPNGTSSAVFSQPGGRQKLVAEGRMIGPDVQVLRIETGRVQINDNGDTRWLVFETQAAPAGAGPAAVDNDVSPTRVTSQETPVFRQRLINLRSSLERQTAGPARGFKVTDTRVFTLMRGGLKEGDIITSINGNGFSRSEDLTDFAYSWSPSNTYRYTVLRNGAALTIGN